MGSKALEDGREKERYTRRLCLLVISSMPSCTNLNPVLLNNKSTSISGEISIRLMQNSFFFLNIGAYAISQSVCACASFKSHKLEWNARIIVNIAIVFHVRHAASCIWDRERVEIFFYSSHVSTFHFETMCCIRYQLIFSTPLLVAARPLLTICDIVAPSGSWMSRTWMSHACH